MWYCYRYGVVQRGVPTVPELGDDKSLHRSTRFRGASSAERECTIGTIIAAERFLTDWRLRPVCRVLGCFLNLSTINEKKKKKTHIFSIIHGPAVERVKASSAVLFFFLSTTDKIISEFFYTFYKVLSGFFFPKRKVTITQNQTTFKNQSNTHYVYVALIQHVIVRTRFF